MAQPEGEDDVVTESSARRTPALGMWRRLLRNPLGMISTLVLFGVVFLACITPLLPLPDPNYGSLAEAMRGPSAGHLLGTDATGRDVLSRLLWGAQVNLLGAALAVFVAFVIGVPGGLVAGYYAGRFDTVGSWFNNLVMALPGIVVLLSVRSVFGPSIWLSMVIFGVMLSPAYFRLVRAAVQSVRGELYIDAAVVSGVSDVRILGRHIVAVVRAPIIIQGARLAVIAIAIQAGLEFIGISDPSVPSWGGMLNEGFRRISETPLLIFWPSLAIGLTSVALVLLSNALRDALEDRNAVPPTRRRRTRRQTHTPAAPAAATDDGKGAPPAAADEPAGALLAVSDLCVAYQSGNESVGVVHGVSFSIREGEVLGLVGESGSGKSQTAFSVLGLLPDGGTVTAGSIRYAGRELTTLRDRDMTALRGSEIAYVPQEPMSNLDPAFPIGHHLIVPMRKKLGLSKSDATDRALDLLDRVGINEPRKTFRAYPFEVSGGMAQRVLIAGAVSCGPRLLIADEPTTALDVTVQAEVLEVMRDLRGDNGMAMLIVTHNFGVVADICDRVAVMSAGRIVENGPARDVLRSPQHEYTRELLDAMLEEEVFRDRLDVDQPRADIHRPGGVGMKP
jgi:ABC-type dipeptide/oligopeptide/nickel transport system ATPase component/ABC-type dipeptide/oligopeptide/nickel transport system permease subunit